MFISRTVLSWANFLSLCFDSWRLLSLNLSNVVWSTGYCSGTSFQAQTQFWDPSGALFSRFFFICNLNDFVALQIIYVSGAFTVICAGFNSSKGQWKSQSWMGSYHEPSIFQLLGECSSWKTLIIEEIIQYFWSVLSRSHIKMGAVNNCRWSHVYVGEWETDCLSSSFIVSFIYI